MLPSPGVTAVPLHVISSTCIYRYRHTEVKLDVGGRWFCQTFSLSALGGTTAWGSLCYIFSSGSFGSSRCISEHGFIGYSPELLQNNTLPDYSPGESFFTVFGVFFPAATGTVICWGFFYARVGGINAWCVKLRTITDLHRMYI